MVLDKINALCFFLQGFGYLIPSHVRSKVLGVVFDSSVFPSLGGSHKSGTRLTVSTCSFPHWLVQHILVIKYPMKCSSAL